MISKPTVLVLGAGASQKYGFPSGTELKNQVVRTLSGEGSSLFERYSGMGYNEQEVRRFRDALKQSGVPSVDAFLEHRQEFLGIGKTAIAEILIPYENENKLFGASEDWYGFLLDRLNTPFDRFQENQITILTFNYDRSLEWYIFKALQARYGMNNLDAINLLKKLRTIHLYGTLGGLPWENGRAYQPSIEWPKPNVTYGPEIKFDIILASNKIKIIHEGILQDQEFTRALEALSAAKRIVFLGFGYNKVNVERLRPKEWRSLQDPVLGSAFGLTELEKTVARRYIEHRTEFGEKDWDVLRYLREKVDLEAN